MGVNFRRLAAGTRIRGDGTKWKIKYTWRLVVLCQFLPSLPCLFYWRMVFDRSLRVAAIPTLRGAGIASLIVFVEFYRAERARLEGGGCPVFRHG